MIVERNESDGKQSEVNWANLKLLTYSYELEMITNLTLYAEFTMKTKSLIKHISKLASIFLMKKLHTINKMQNKWTITTQHATGSTNSSL